MLIEKFYKKEENGYNGIERIYGRYECDECKSIYERLERNEKKMAENPLCDKNYCTFCWRTKLNNRPEYLKNMSEAIKKMYKDKPYIIDKKRKSMMGKNSGDSNGMKKPEARKKVSETRKKMFRDHPELKKINGDKIRAAWATGKFDGVRVGQCKWYDYTASDGKIHKVQGTWELAFIKWLDESKLSFLCHRKWIPYIYDGKKKNWYPDFFVNDWYSYIDVKCEHFYDENKFKAIRLCNPDIDVKVLFKKDLQKLGVKI